MTPTAYLTMCCIGTLLFLLAIPFVAACMLSSRISREEERKNG